MERINRVLNFLADFSAPLPYFLILTPTKKMKEYIATVVTRRSCRTYSNTEVEVRARNEEEVKSRLLKAGIREVHQVRLAESPALPRIYPCTEVSLTPATYNPKHYAIKSL